MVAGIHEVWPDIKFVGLALGIPNADYNPTLSSTQRTKTPTCHSLPSATISAARLHNKYH
jgi:hypothetical protein